MKHHAYLISVRSWLRAGTLGPAGGLFCQAFSLQEGEGWRGAHLRQHFIHNQSRGERQGLKEKIGGGGSDNSLIKQSCFVRAARCKGI